MGRRACRGLRAEEAGEVFGDLGGEGLGRDAAEAGEGGDASTPTGERVANAGTRAPGSSVAGDQALGMAEVVRKQREVIANALQMADRLQRRPRCGVQVGFAAAAAQRGAHLIRDVAVEAAGM